MTLFRSCFNTDSVLEPFNWNVCYRYWQFPPSQNVNRDVTFGSVQGQEEVLIRSFTPILKTRNERVKGKRFSASGLGRKVALTCKRVGVCVLVILVPEFSEALRIFAWIKNLHYVIFFKIDALVTNISLVVFCCYSALAGLTRGLNFLSVCRAGNC